MEPPGRLSDRGRAKVNRMSTTYQKLFLAVLPVTFRENLSVQQWGETAQKMAEGLAGFAGVTVEAPPELPPAATPEPAPAAPATAPEPIAAKVVEARTDTTNPFGPAFDGWDVPALRLCLAACQELALAEQHNAPEDVQTNLLERLGDAVTHLGKQWNENRKKG